MFDLRHGMQMPGIFGIDTTNRRGREKGLRIIGMRWLLIAEGDHDIVETCALTTFEVALAPNVE